MSKLLHRYNNGGYTVDIFDDGTKIRTIIPPEFPESIDIKITNQCDLSNHCKWCHEGSHKEGKHANLNELISRLNELPDGVEIAIGGGNPLSHPDLVTFLKLCKNHLVANITINQLHVNQYRELITKLITEELVHGIGITYSGKSDIQWLHDLSDHVVYHMIIGVHNVEDVNEVDKVLILGYKKIRKGSDYFSGAVKDNIREWYTQLPVLLTGMLGMEVISFDNLALDQLNVKRLLTDEAWNELFMGDDGTFTFYMDAVEKEYAMSSTSLDIHPWFDLSAAHMFQDVARREDG